MSENTDPFVVLARWLTPPAQFATHELSTADYNSVVAAARNREIAQTAAQIRASQPGDHLKVSAIRLHALAIRIAALERAAR